MLLGGVIGAAIYFTRVMRRVSAGEEAAVLGQVTVVLTPTPTPTTKVLVTQTTMVTVVSTITGTMSVSVPATTTGAKGPECTGAMGVAASCAGEFEAGDLLQPAKDGKGGKEGK